MEVLSLAVLLGVSGGLLYTKKTAKDKRRAREGFQEIMNPGVAKAFNALHNEYVQTSASRFNPIQNLMDPNNNVLLPPNFSSQDVTKVQKNLRNATASALATPNDPSFNLSRDPKKNILLNAGGKGTAMEAIKTCEAIKNIDCNAFDKEDFAFNCGVCFQDGKTASGNPTVGGLYITEDDRASAEAVAKRMNSRTVNYQPSTGKCASNMFVTTKAQCVALKKKLDCANNQSFDTEDCSQCFQDQSFHYTDKDLVKTPPMLVLAGSGDMTIVKAGANDTNIKATLTDAPQQFEIPDFNEGDVLQIALSPATASIAGYLIGQTPSGDFRMDIIRLIQTDMITGAKPRLAGVKQVGDDSYTLIKPGRGKTAMKLALLNTFTFIEISEQEAVDCGSAPYISKEASATFLESSPCFKRGQKPGSYSMDCLQTTFVGAGCTEQGEAYPSTQSKAQALMTGPNGKLLTIGQIAGNIYDKSTTAYTGLREDGSKLGIQEWDKVSRFCTGKSITSPCDFDNKEAGPLSAECLSYLWKNTGAVENVPGNVGSTYSSSSRQASLNAMNNDRFCTPSGTMAPIDDQGKINEAAVAAARAKGGVAAVKEFYNQIHLKANDNTQSDDARKDSLMQCYGVEFQKVEAQTSNEKVTAGTGTMIPQQIYDTLVGPIPSKEKEITLGPNWKFSFSLTPTGTVPNWTSIFHVSHNKSDWDGFGSRTPGIWFIPNETRIRVHLTFDTDLGWYLDTQVGLPLNSETTVTCSLISNVFTIKFSGAVEYSISRPGTGRPYVGKATLFVPDPFWPGFVGTMKNFSFSTSENPYPSVLDFKPGRTKSGMNKAPGRKYVKIKDTNYPYNDIVYNPGMTLEDCKSGCDDTTGCVGFTFHQDGNKTCWFKSALLNSSPLAGYDSYKLVAEGGKNYTDPDDWNKYNCPVKVLGNFGMAPWGKTWEGLQNFPDDGTAKWIWTNPNAATNEPLWNTWPFYYKYQNDGDTISARLYVWADNIAWVSFNDTVLASDYASGRIMEFEIPPGENALHINASNQGGPAGLLVICIDTKTNKTLFVSDENWKSFSSFCRGGR